jgi:hypothetical protein
MENHQAQRYFLTIKRASITKPFDGEGTKTMSKVTPQLIESLRNELTQVRRASLNATRNGDFMKVARLTTQAARINKTIMDAESQMIADL